MYMSAKAHAHLCLHVAAGDHFVSRFNPLLQRRVLLPGSVFPVNLLGKSLPKRYPFSFTSFLRWRSHY
jgi:hypothetical protein